jgi:hypothetical protein
MIAAAEEKVKRKMAHEEKTSRLQSGIKVTVHFLSNFKGALACSEPLSL